MKEKKPINRMCIVTKKMLPKKQLVRIVKTTSGEIVIDSSGKLNGRGAYVASDITVFEKMIKTKALNRAFSQNISADVYAKLTEDFSAKYQ